MTRPTPDQIAVMCEQESTHDFLRAQRYHGYRIINIEAMRHWWDHSEDAVDPYSLMNWIEEQ